MKFKTTKKVINEVYRNIICVGYADLHYLLNLLEPTAYTAGVYGWNADIYNINNVVIVTGYRPFGNIKPDYTIVDKYEELAKNIYIDTKDYTECKEKLNNLINEFIEEVTR
jgi:hypothetical protein|nr:MAG TPA: Pyroglutamyl peptidase [Caudoviricetes sp.]